MHRSALVCLLAAFAIAGVAAEPEVRPTHQQIRAPGHGKVICTFATPLNACRFRVSDVGNQLFEKLQNYDLGHGSMIGTFVQYELARVTVQYAGAGLAQGDCGIRLNLTPKIAGTRQTVLFQCFGRAENGSWSQGVSLLTAHNREYLPSNSSTPYRLEVRQGEDVSLLLATPDAVHGCGFTLPPQRWTPYLPSTYERLGADHGDCGVVVNHVQTKNAGVWRWGTTHRELEGATALRATLVLVLTSPQGKPILTVHNSTSLRVGDVLRATCRAQPTVPPAKLTWLLGDQIVRQDAFEETEEADLVRYWPWQPQSTVQTLNLVLTSGNVMRMLECRARQPFHASSARVKLRIEAAPSGSNSKTTPHQPFVPTPRYPTQSPTTPIVLTPRSPTSQFPPPTGATLSPRTSPVPAPITPTPRSPTSQFSSPTGPTLNPKTSTPQTAAPEFLCPPLPTRFNGVHCVLPRKNGAPCGNGSHPLGTQASLKCNAGFLPREGVPTVLNTTCTRRGWRPRKFVCDYDCGIRNSPNVLAADAKDAQPPEFPWHVAVFEKYEDAFEPICGGALISINYFVSAAHCYFDDATETRLNASNYLASVGKRSLDWETLDRHEQRRSIERILIPEHFSGTLKFLESDMALVQLSEPVDFTLAVRAVCVHWKNSFDEELMLVNNTGVVPTWGVRKNNTPTTSLHFNDMPFSPYRQCRDIVTSDFAVYLISDKICGGYRDRLSPVCQGDAGNGFVFPLQSHKGVRYYVRGVLSSSAGQRDDSDLQCQDEKMATFTGISIYVAWIWKIVKPGAEDDSLYD